MNPETIRSYDSDLRNFRSACRERGFDPLNLTVSQMAQVLRLWVAEGCAKKTIVRRCAAIGGWQALSGVDNPPVTSRAMRAIKQEVLRTAPAPKIKGELTPADVDSIRRHCEGLANRLMGLRNKAIFESAWALNFGARRLQAMRVGHVFGPTATKASRAVWEWSRAAGITKGPLFRNLPLGRPIGLGLTEDGIRRICRDTCKAIGKTDGTFSVGSIGKGRVAHEVRRGNLRELTEVAGDAAINTALKTARRRGDFK